MDRFIVGLMISLFRFCLLPLYLLPTPLWASQARPGESLFGAYDDALTQKLAAALTAKPDACMRAISATQQKDIQVLIERKALAISLVDLNDQRIKLAHINGKVPLCTASMAKIAILAAVFKARQDGLITIDDDLGKNSISRAQLKLMMAEDPLPVVRTKEAREMIVPSINAAAANIADIVNKAAWDHEEKLHGKKTKVHNQCYVNQQMVELGFSVDVGPTSKSPKSKDKDLRNKAANHAKKSDGQILWLGKSYRFGCVPKAGYKRWCHCGYANLERHPYPRGMRYGIGTQVASGLGIASFYAALGSNQVFDGESRKMIREIMSYPCPSETQEANYNRFVAELCERPSASKGSKHQLKIYRKSGSLNFRPDKDNHPEVVRRCMGDSALVEYPNGPRYSLNVMCNNETPPRNRCPHNILKTILNRVDCMMHKEYSIGQQNQPKPSTQKSKSKYPQTYQ